MQRALEMAARAGEAGEAPIGALLWDPNNERVLWEGGNAPIALQDPSAHAEILALRAGGGALGNYRLSGMWLYVTLEPCAMCAGAISHARIERLVFGAADAKGGAVHHGPRFFEQPTCHWHPQIRGDVQAQASAALLRAFFKARRGQ